MRQTKPRALLVFLLESADQQLQRQINRRAFLDRPSARSSFARVFSLCFAAQWLLSKAINMPGLQPRGFSRHANRRSEVIALICTEPCYTALLGEEGLASIGQRHVTFSAKTMGRMAQASDL